MQYAFKKVFVPWQKNGSNLFKARKTGAIYYSAAAAAACALLCVPLARVVVVIVLVE